MTITTTAVITKYWYCCNNDKNNYSDNDNKNNDYDKIGYNNNNNNKINNNNILPYQYYIKNISIHSVESRSMIPWEDVKGCVCFDFMPSFILLCLTKLSWYCMLEWYSQSLDGLGRDSAILSWISASCLNLNIISMYILKLILSGDSKFEILLFNASSICETKLLGENDFIDKQTNKWRNKWVHQLINEKMDYLIE